jgi:hypothetical protein
MTGRTIARYFILMPILLATALVAGCVGFRSGGDDEGITIPSMIQGRWGHTATLLKDGRLLVVGGQETRHLALASAEVYDPTTKTWSTAGSMSEARGLGHTATYLEDGRVLVVGGSGTTEIYDPSTGTWSPTGNMVEPRIRHSATLLGDGRVLVAGGLDPTRSGEQETGSAEIYDPSTGQWSSTGSMVQKHSRHNAALLRDGRVLVAGTYSAEVYDPSTGTWSLAGKPLRERDQGFPMTVLGDGRVLVVGGEIHTGGWTGIYAPIKNVDIYDPATGTWSAAGPLAEPYKLHPATLLKDGRVLVIGNDRQTEVYDPATNKWSSLNKMKLPRIEGHSATLLGDGTVLVVGGYKKVKESGAGFQDPNAEVTALSTVEIYDPAAPVKK